MKDELQGALSVSKPDSILTLTMAHVKDFLSNLFKGNNVQLARDATAAEERVNTAHQRLKTLEHTIQVRQRELEALHASYGRLNDAYFNMQVHLNLSAQAQAAQAGAGVGPAGPQPPGPPPAAGTVNGRGPPN